MDYLLAIDIGTSACKAAVFDTNGSLIDSRVKAYPINYPQTGYAEQNPEDWWSGVCAALKEMLDGGGVKPSDIKAIGVDGQSWSAVAVDKQGDVLLPNPIWLDTRADEICAGIKREMGEEVIFNLCGNPFSPSYTTPKLLWFKENYPEIFSRAYAVLQSNGYIAHKLTGKFTLDSSQCYGYHFYDMRKNRFDKNMAAALNISMDLIPDIYDCAEIIGAVTKQAADLTGLREGTPVVAGGLDAACGALGAGVITAGQTQEQGGQAGGMSICIEQYNAHPKLIVSRHVVPQKWLLQGGTVGGGGVMKWLGEKYFPDLSFKQMDELALDIPAGCGDLIFLPYLAGERSPLWDRYAKGVFFGLDYTKSRADLIRAAMEGAAFALLHNLKTAEETSVNISSLTAMGGAANSKLWTQIKSDMTGKEISVCGSDTATVLGAAMLAGVGIGLYKDFDEAVKKTVKINRVHKPDMQNHEIYANQFQIYLKLYENLKELMRGERL